MNFHKIFIIFIILFNIYFINVCDSCFLNLCSIPCLFVHFNWFGLTEYQCLHANRSFASNKTQINGSQVNISTSNKLHPTGSQHHKIQVNRTQVKLLNSNESHVNLLNQTTVKPNPVAAVIIGRNKSAQHLGSLNDDSTTSTTVLPPQVNHSTPMKIFDNNHSIQSSTEGSISEKSTSTTTISSVSTTSTTTQTVIHTENHISFVNYLNRTPTHSAYNPEYLYALDLASQLNGYNKNMTNS